MKPLDFQIAPPVAQGPLAVRDRVDEDELIHASYVAEEADRKSTRLNSSHYS